MSSSSQNSTNPLIAKFHQLFSDLALVSSIRSCKNRKQAGLGREDKLLEQDAKHEWS
jgi:hypothetical protein